MNSGLKQRLVGAIVLGAIAVLVLPSFLRDRQVEPVSTQTLIPDRPAADESLTFDEPQAPDDIEPAPDPETMFMPDESEQPVVEDLEQAREAAPPSDDDADNGESSSPETDESPQERPEAEVEAAEGEAWVVQVASFRSHDSARSLRDRLQEEGHRAYVRTARAGGREVSRVFIGPKISRPEAEKTKQAVDEALQLDTLIVRFEP